MRRLLQRAFDFTAAVSAVLCIAACVLWVRGRTGSDELAWTWDRYLSNRSAASNQVSLTSDKRLWLGLLWGRVGPFNGQLVWGYYINADQSGGHPRLTYHHALDDASQISVFADADSGSFPKVDLDRGTSGWGPLRWYTDSRSRPKDGDDFRYIRVGVSHWLAVMVLLTPPMLWLNRFRKARRTRGLGLCCSCGYDLRATPDRCPECGAVASPAFHSVLQPGDPSCKRVPLCKVGRGVASAGLFCDSNWGATKKRRLMSCHSASISGTVSRTCSHGIIASNEASSPMGVQRHGGSVGGAVRGDVRAVGRQHLGTRRNLRTIFHQ